MRFRCLICGLLLLVVAPLYAGNVLDRIVATVNGNPILESDLDDEVRYEALMNGAEQKPGVSEDRKAALDRLVDRQLLSTQVAGTEFVQTTADEIEKQLEQIKSDYSNSKNSWSDALSRYGFTESEVRDRIAQELNQLKLIDARLRPSVQIDQSAIEVYYNGEYLPELRQAHAQPVLLQEATPKIREVLIQKSINAGLVVWLETLRSQAEVRFFGPNSPSADRGQ